MALPRGRIVKAFENAVETVRDAWMAGAHV
jgi:hypothetical protein